MYNLESVDVSFTLVSSLAPLARLTKLDTISCKGNDIRDISCLSGLHLLRDLDLPAGLQQTFELLNQTRLYFAINWKA